MNKAKAQLARMWERAAEYNIALPDADMVIRTIEPVRGICPCCKELRKPNDWVYMPNVGQLEVYCWDCLPKSDHARNVGVRAALNDSALFVQGCIDQVVPSRWAVKRPRRWTKTDATDILLTEMLKEAIRRFTPCIGSFSRRWHYNGVDYIDSHKPCKNRKAKTYCTRVGFLCVDCLYTSAYDYETARTQVDLKMRKRLICEGSRFLAIMAGLSSQVPELQDTWGLNWIDWGRSAVETTDECLTWPFCPSLEADEDRLGKLERA